MGWSQARPRDMRVVPWGMTREKNKMQKDLPKIFPFKNIKTQTSTCRCENKGPHKPTSWAACGGQRGRGRRVKKKSSVPEIKGVTIRQARGFVNVERRMKTLKITTFKRERTTAQKGRIA